MYSVSWYFTVIMTNDAYKVKHSCVLLFKNVQQSVRFTVYFFCPGTVTHRAQMHLR